MNNEMNIMEINNLTKYYGKNKILDNLNLNIERGEFISIEGSSGSGKSTFLNLLGLLDSSYEGSIVYKERNIKDLKEREINAFRNKEIGFIFQFYNLLEDFTVLENVIIPSLINKYSERKEKELKAIKLLEVCNIRDKLNEKIHNLSGGEKQRVAIARALINNPSVLLADEPTGNLDFETSQSIHQLFKTINEEMKQTIIVVTHNKELANIAHKHYILDKRTKRLENI